MAASAYDLLDPGAMSDCSATRRILVLGATGSVGRQALEVAAAGGIPQLEVVGLAAGRQHEQVLASGRGLGNVPVMVADASAREAAMRSGYGGTIVASVADLIEQARPDLVLNAIVGAAGLEATLAALDRGIAVALANKESLVAGGPACLATAARTGAPILPVDSEHSALLQCMDGQPPDMVDTLVLTASGGPFFGRDRSSLAEVGVEEALDHPTWSMGGKITIDSATLFNKALEVIEASVLMGIDAGRIEVVVQRQSLVHALVRHLDGSLLAHLGWPDMRAPIAHALGWPHRRSVQTRRLDLANMPALRFEEVDHDAFPALRIGRAALAAGPAACCALNAANEVAVEAFLAGMIPFLAIADVVAATLEGEVEPLAMTTLDQVRVVDTAARHTARAQVERVASHA